MAHSSGLVITWTTGPNSMALMRKSAAEVALNLQNHIFAVLDSSLRQWMRVRECNVLSLCLWFV